MNSRKVPVNKSSSEVEIEVEKKIREKKVMVISKSSCPFCARTKDLFKGYMGKGPQALKRADFGVWELGYGPETRDIQDYLQRKTGKSTVPRVFIEGKCIGGCDDTFRLYHKGKLDKMLKDLYPMEHSGQPGTITNTLSHTKRC